MYCFVFTFLKMATYRRNMSESTSLFMILGAVAKLRKVTTGLVMSVCPSVRQTAWNYSAPNQRTFKK